MEEKKHETYGTLRGELIRLKLDARLLPLHEWLERANAILEQVERKAITQDRLTRVIGSGRVVEVRKE
jgi:hypothetical protein